MAYRKSTQVQAFRPAANARGPENIVIPFSHTLTSALANTDVIGLAKLPKQHIITGLFVSVPDFDTNATPTLVIDFGLWEDDATPTVVDVDCVIDGSTAGQAGGLITAPNVATFLTIAPSDSDRIFGMLAEVGPATGATAVTIRGLLYARNARYDD